MPVDDGHHKGTCLVRHAHFVQVRSGGNQFPNRVELSVACREEQRRHAANYGGADFTRTEKRDVTGTSSAAAAAACYPAPACSRRSPGTATPASRSCRGIGFHGHDFTGVERTGVLFEFADARREALHQGGERGYRVGRNRRRGGSVGGDGRLLFRVGLFFDGIRFFGCFRGRFLPFGRDRVAVDIHPHLFELRELRRQTRVGTVREQQLHHGRTIQ